MPPLAMEKRSKLLAAFMIVLLLVLFSCGGGDSSQGYFYSVDVVNATDALIAVRYDWDIIWWTYEWLGEVTIAPGNSEIIEWSSGKAAGERIEVEYLGKKKLYTVPQMGTLTVTVQDFT